MKCHCNVGTVSQLVLTLSLRPLDGSSHSLAYERNMQNILRILHYVVFGMGFVTAADLVDSFKGLVVICNAILVSVAVWNQNIGPSSPSVCE